MVCAGLHLSCVSQVEKFICAIKSVRHLSTRLMNKKALNKSTFFIWVDSLLLFNPTDAHCGPAAWKQQRNLLNIGSESSYTHWQCAPTIKALTSFQLLLPLVHAEASLGERRERLMSYGNIKGISFFCVRREGIHSWWQKERERDQGGKQEINGSKRD